MLKTRLNAADLVAADFLKAERAADEAALLASNCVSTMLRARTDAKLPVTIGVQALQLVGEASSDLLKARQRLIEAHLALAEVRDQIGLRHHVTAYGDEGECQIFGPTGADDRGAPRLAIVA